MDASIFDELPRSYRLGLRLKALGADDELIAECLGIDTGSIVTLLDIGARKLENAQRATRYQRTDEMTIPASVSGEVGGVEPIEDDA